MRLALTAFTALSLTVLETPGHAQTAAELLQKGIYTQETAGDLDGAIQIYRQILASSPGQRTYAAQAQYRLAQIMLQKGDVSGAARELDGLARNYPESGALIRTMMSARGSQGSGSPPQLGLGSVQNGRYRHNRSGMEIAVPSGWSVAGDGASSDSGDMVQLKGPAPAELQVGVWIRKEDSTPAEIAAKLNASVPNKAEMNRDTPGYRFRKESIHPRTLGGFQALSAVADLGESEKLVEYYTWIYTGKTHVLFLATTVEAKLPALQAAVDQMAATAIIP